MDERPDKWQAASDGDSEPTVPAPDGYTPLGPWEPIGAWISSDDVRHGEDTQRFYSGVVWRRPLKKS